MGLRSITTPGGPTIALRRTRLAVVFPSFGSNRANVVDCDTRPADGTLIWCSPSRHTYVTTPGSALLFPSLCEPTGEIAQPRQPDRLTAIVPRWCHSGGAPARRTAPSTLPANA